MVESDLEESFLCCVSFGHGANHKDPYWKQWVCGAGVYVCDCVWAFMCESVCMLGTGNTEGADGHVLFAIQTYVCMHAASSVETDRNKSTAV